MDQHAQRSLTDRLLPAVLAAGLLEMGYFKTGIAVTTKADQSPVTIADQQAEAVILAALAQTLPGVPVIAEEAYAAGIRPPIGDRFVLVDALDGTRQFVSGHPEFTINIAVVERGRPVWGLVYVPALNDLMVTCSATLAVRARVAPQAAVVTLDTLEPVAIRVRPVPAEGITAVQSQARNAEVTEQYLAGFSVAGRRRLGSSYKFCLIASGEADIYPQLGDTCEWDTAAGEAVLCAAGGHVSALVDRSGVATETGLPILYGKVADRYLNPPFVASSAPITTLRGTVPKLTTT
jgi:3'(2'), 5'-bisphosphate nucleotidase